MVGKRKSRRNPGGSRFLKWALVVLFVAETLWLGAFVWKTGLWFPLGPAGEESQEDSWLSSRTQEREDDLRVREILEQGE
ncbi:hypothetical protein HQ520_03215, partial [bacterium]|nr:hypothetical protein [bacterium]